MNTTSIETEAAKHYEIARKTMPGSRFWHELTNEERHWFCVFYGSVSGEYATAIEHFRTQRDAAIKENRQ